MDPPPTRQLRDSGIEVPVVGLGCNNFGTRLDEDATERVVNAAIDAGVSFFDTADIYGAGRSEAFIGRALAGRRDQVVIATKFGGDMGAGTGGGSAAYVREAVTASLRRLGTDHIDLYQHHFPDEDVSLEETLEALDELVRAGTVRAVGSSNYSGARIEEAERISAERGWAHFVTAQNHYSLLERREVEEDVVPACARYGIGILPYFPLASGLLSGKYGRHHVPPSGTRLASNSARAAELLTDANLTLVDSLRDLAERRGHTVLELAIAGLAAQPEVVSVIAGATSPEQVTANARSARWTLTEDDLAEIDSITKGRSLG